MQRLRRYALAGRGASFPHRGAEHRRSVRDVDRPFFGVDRRHRKIFLAQGAEDRPGDRQGDPRAAPLPRRSRTGCSKSRGRQGQSRS